MQTTTSKNMLLRWLIVCLVPLATIAALFLSRPLSPVGELIGGIILACEAAFLFKFVLFETIKHHLKHEHAFKRQTMWLFAPIVLLVLYLFHYFGAF